MEMIKSIVRQCYPLLIMMTCVVFVIYIFFSAQLNNGEGIFEGVGSIYESMLGTDEVMTGGFSYIGSNIDVPILKYNSGVKTVGDCVNFRSLLLVQKEDGTWVDGSVEDEFALYLLDITNKEGYSVLETLSSEEIAELEEIPATFVYDKVQDRLYIYGSGIYVVYVKIYGSSGGQEVYEFQLPVETM